MNSQDSFKHAGDVIMILGPGVWKIEILNISKPIQMYFGYDKFERMSE